jgi:predicted RNA-binding protein YlqC (UPF0109 family)
MNTIQDTLLYILKAIITPSDEIVVETRETDGVLLLEIAAPIELTGQIIGKEGKIIKAIRTILTLTYPQTRFSLEIKN